MPAGVVRFKRTLPLEVWMLRTNWIAAWVLAAASVGAIGCASGSSGSGDTYDRGVSNSREVTVIVDNLNTSDATLYMIWGAGNRVRLGRISGLSEGEFTSRWYGPEVRMEARFLAGETYVTNSLPVSPGEVLELRLPGSLD
jgi:hypothetical protein